jgi:hypothetical protein
MARLGLKNIVGRSQRLSYLYQVRLIQYGQRTVLNLKDGEYTGLVVMDFNQRRLKAHDMLGAHAQGEVCLPGNEVSARLLEYTGELVLCAQDAQAKRKYVKTSISLGKVDYELYLVLVDDEYGRCMQIHCAE